MITFSPDDARNWATANNLTFQNEPDLFREYQKSLPNWTLIQERLLGSDSIRNKFFNSVDPAIQNKFLLSIRNRLVELMVESFSQFKDQFTEQELELIRYSLIDCNFNPDLFFSGEEVQP